MSDICKQLKEPFSTDKVKWRVGKKSKDGNRGLALAYIDSRAVMDRLDDVVGPDNWQRKHDFGPDGEVLCGIGIRIDDEWIWKWDGAAQTKFEGEKGGLSDSFKRAAVSWGIGRYLYDLDSNWVDLDKYNNIRKEPSLPNWARPSGASKQNGKSEPNNSNNTPNNKPNSNNGNEKLINEINQYIDDFGGDPQKLLEGVVGKSSLEDCNKKELNKYLEILKKRVN